MVVVDSSAHYDYPIVDTDQAQGARLATEHLLDLGHETVWHIAGPESSFAAKRRRDSWEQTLERPRLPDSARAARRLVGSLGVRSGSPDRGATPRSPRCSLRTTRWRSGCCARCTSAVGAVPDDVSVVGFDDMEEAAHFWPPLTTVRQSFAEVGRRSVEALLTVIQSGAHEHREVLVPTELVVRSSTSGPSRVRG